MQKWWEFGLGSKHKVSTSNGGWTDHKSNDQEASKGIKWKEFIWANPARKVQSNQIYEGIGANRDVEKSINMIMTADGNDPHNFGN